MWSTAVCKLNNKDGVIRYAEKDSNRTAECELKGSALIVQSWRTQNDPHYHITTQEYAVPQWESVELWSYLS
jgi:hypothetical protein